MSLLKQLTTKTKCVQRTSKDCDYYEKELKERELTFLNATESKSTASEIKKYKDLLEETQSALEDAKNNRTAYMDELATFLELNKDAEGIAGTEQLVAAQKMMIFDQQEEIIMSDTQSSIPCSTTSRRTTVINASIATVWNQVKDLTFQWTAQEEKDRPTCIVGESEDSKEVVKHAEVGRSRILSYPVGGETKQTIRVTEISFRNYSLGWSLTSSDPSVSYSSREDVLRLTEINFPLSGDAHQTLVDWTSDFSSDVDVSVIQDANMKKEDALKSLLAFCKPAGK